MLSMIINNFLWIMDIGNKIVNITFKWLIIDFLRYKIFDG
jgi:hypothetical protein